MSFKSLSRISFLTLFLVACTSPQLTPEPEYLSVEGISFDKTNAEMTIGETLKIIPTLLPQGTVMDGSVQWDESVAQQIFWKSDNTGVATVDQSGIVTAVGKGSCTISLICGAIAAKCKVTVRFFPESMLYGMWLFNGSDSVLLDIDGTGKSNGKDLTWTFDGMRLGIKPMNDDVMVLTTVGDMSVNFHYAGDQKTHSITKIAYPMDERLFQNGLVTVNGTKYKAVDLGLPSGALWAVHNVGADKPEGTGNFFAWAETEGKTRFLLSEYKWYDDSTSSLTKYSDSDSLLPSDDAASVIWGGSWHMPSPENVSELLDNCHMLYGSVNGQLGVAMVPKAAAYGNNRLFIPFSGYYDGSRYSASLAKGFFWTSSLSNVNPMNAGYFSVGVDKLPSDVILTQSTSPRYKGLCIRPVAARN